MAARAALTFTAFAIAYLDAAQLPNTWPRCRIKDPHRDTCLRYAIQVALSQIPEGIPELDIPAQEPMIAEAGLLSERRPGRISLDLRVSNLSTLGLANAEVISVYTDLERNVVDIYSRLPVSSMSANVEVEGMILHELVSKQTGKVKMNFYGVDGFFVFSGRTVERGNETYFDVTEVTIDVLSLDTFEVFFDQLDKNPHRSLKLNQLLNVNALAFWPRLRDHLSSIHTDIIRGVANNVFSKVPLKDIFLDDDHPAVKDGPATFVLVG